jgi:UPF0176 protein
VTEFQIITFYEFREMPTGEKLVVMRDRLRRLMCEVGVKGTIILALEGFNATVCGAREAVDRFLSGFEEICTVRPQFTTSSHDSMPFRRIDVKIKPEIVTLKQCVDISYGAGSHVDAAEWNRLITDPETLVLDARNDYEVRTGTFRGAVNPETRRFSELPAFVEHRLDPSRHRRIATFCTGGVRCEKLVPYLKQQGFREVYQLRGGILKYLEEVAPGASLWEGECFVFDDRVTLDHDLSKGTLSDFSQLQKPSEAE